ncbi:MAG: hypothetical protein OEZ58_14475 [Gammaproteobacteria bacterium]|nr:hypothetical protein [Gammaproteobacteria bacterium]
MSLSHITIEQARSMIGVEVRFQETHCTVIEVLEDGPSVVLLDRSRGNDIQADQHGEAHRRVPKTYVIKILNPSKDEFSLSFLALDPLI